MLVQLLATRHFLSEQKKTDMQQFVLAAVKQVKKATFYNLVNLLCGFFE